MIELLALALLAALCMLFIERDKDADDPEMLDLRGWKNDERRGR